VATEGETIMTRVERILCPVDFSEGSRHAIDQAVALAHWYGAAVTALYVCPPLALAPYIDSRVYPLGLGRPKEDLERLRRELEQFVQQEGGGPAVTTVVKEGLITGEILRYIESVRADLLVMGTHGRSGFERFMLGSVAESVLRQAPCPVLTVPPRAPDVVPMGPTVYRRVLCGIDYSACSLKALDYAASLAHRGDAELIVVNVLEPILDYVAATVADIDNTTLRTAAERQLGRVVKERTLGRQGVTPMLVAGHPAPMILQLAEEQAVDVIVLGIEHRSHLNMMWFGSTANRVVRRATCPVLTVRG
jgi:nucleotide-binding universal stress UspA family protein